MEAIALDSQTLAAERMAQLLGQVGHFRPRGHG